MRRIVERFKLWIMKIKSIVISKFTDWREIYYVGSSEALPPPLSTDEEGELLERLEQGDVSVRDILYERNLRLVVYIAR